MVKVKFLLSDCLVHDELVVLRHEHRSRKLLRLYRFGLCAVMSDFMWSVSFVHINLF